MKVVATVAGQLVQLSPRERDVLKLLAHGETNKEIAYALDISIATVKGHISSINGRLAFPKGNRRVQLCLWAMANPESHRGLAVVPALVLPLAPGPAAL